MRLGHVGHRAQRSSWPALVTDGNSLVYGFRGTGQPVGVRIGDVLAARLGVTHASAATSGHTWADMLAAMPDVNGKMVVAWEGTNSVVLGRTPQQAIDDAEAYATAARAGGAALLVTGTCLMRQGGWPTSHSSADALCDSLRQYNHLLRVHYRDLGFDGLADPVGSGAIFGVVTDGSDSTFVAANTRAGANVWLESSNRIHLNDLGDALVARYFEEALRQI